jgi:hypothetical protein
MPPGEWNEYKSSHFIVYYQNGIEKKYIKEFTAKCEKYYFAITDRLGFKRFNFWLWEKRARVFVYKTREDYLTGSGRAEWSGASVFVKNKFISTFYFEGDFFDVILPHELSHIILREFIGQNTRTPLWFDEGVACANEKDSLIRYLLAAKRLVDRHAYLEVPMLERVYGEKTLMPDIFYPMAASLVIFLFEDKKNGKDKFFELCSLLRDGREYMGDTFYTAMKKVYGVSNAQELNDAFLKYIRGVTYGDMERADKFMVKW